MQALQGARTVTLRRVWADYQQSRRSLKASTIKDYDRKINRCFGDWLDLPVATITKDMVEERHRAISETNGPRGSGEALANLGMRILKALLNFAAAKHEIDNYHNPVRRLSEVRAWNRTKRRQTMIKRTQMQEWYAAVMALRNTTVRDYLLMLWLTGSRRSEIARLRFDECDFKEKTFTLQTKNADCHILPMSTYIYDLLLARSKTVDSAYVFPGRDKKTHISLTSKDHSAVIRATGIQFMLHDLRRTYCTIAKILRVDDIILKKLLNHATQDVTAGYLVADAELLRPFIQEINDELIRQAHVL